MPTSEPVTEPSAESRLPARTAWSAAGLAALLTWAAHFPLDWGVLGWLAPVPLVILIRLPDPPRWLLRAVFLTTLVGTAASLQWMRLGDRWMIPAWLSLSVYLSLYTPLLVAVTRKAVHRFRIPIGVAVPLAWVASEYARAHVMTGLAWYFLAHTQYRFVELIQISDLVGAYGVSGLVALAATALALAIPTDWLLKCGWWSRDDQVGPAAPGRGAVPTTIVGGTTRRNEGNQKHRHPDPSNHVISLPISVGPGSGHLCSCVVPRAQDSRPGFSTRSRRSATSRMAPCTSDLRPCAP